MKETDDVLVDRYQALLDSLDPGAQALVELAEDYREWVCEQESLEKLRTFYDESLLPNRKDLIRRGIYFVLLLHHKGGDQDAFYWWKECGLETLRRYQTGVGARPLGLANAFAEGVAPEEAIELYGRALEESEPYANLAETERLADEEAIAKFVAKGVEAEEGAPLLPQFVSVGSSNVDAVAFDESRSTLFVRYKRGRVYAYMNVPKDVHVRLMAAESKGSFLEHHVKGAYACAPVGGASGSAASTKAASSGASGGSGCALFLALLGCLCLAVRP